MASESPSKPHITLHWLEKSRAQRILWLLEECTDITYEVKVYKRGADFLADPALKKVHPLGKSPLVSIQAPGATEPVVLAESAFITEYLAEYFAKPLVPARWTDGKEGTVGGESEAWLRYRFYMHYAEGSLMSMLLTFYLVTMLRDGPQIPFFVKPITRLMVGKMESQFFLPNFKTHFSFLEDQLATAPNGGGYLCGDKLTAVDILMGFPLLAAREGKALDVASYPKLGAYLQRLEGNERYKRSIKISEEKTGEKYSLLM